jgi:hypothetical protein
MQLALNRENIMTDVARKISIILVHNFRLFSLQNQTSRRVLNAEPRFVKLVLRIYVLVVIIGF